MLTAEERRAVLFLAAVAAAGGLVRVVRARSPSSSAPGATLIAPDTRAGDVQRQAALARRAAELARPLRPGETVDVDRAGVEELQRLPRVGPGLARRIVEERDANGPFGSLEGLRRVGGLGAVTLKGLEKKVTFSGVATYRPPEPPNAGRSADSRPVTAASVAGHQSPASANSCPAEPVAVNSATVEELACLPGIGPSLAARIVTYRTAHGPFGEVQQLQQVPGIGPARVRQLQGKARAP